MADWIITVIGNSDVLLALETLKKYFQNGFLFGHSKKNKKIDLKLGMIVRHIDLFNGQEPFEIVGIRKTEVELLGDYSGGTHSVKQKSWMSISGLLFEENGETVKSSKIKCPKCKGEGKIICRKLTHTIIVDCSVCYGNGEIAERRKSA